MNLEKIIKLITILALIATIFAYFIMSEQEYQQQLTMAKHCNQMVSVGRCPVEACK